MIANETRPCVLLVDDNPALVESMALTLDMNGFHVVAAGDGAEAITRLAERQVDLIVADIAMPRMNGYQLFERVRTNPRWFSIPFVFLTARNLDSDVRFGKEMGVDDYLTKPIEPEDLLASVRGKLKRWRQLQALRPTAFAQSAPPADRGLLTVGALSLDLGQHRARYRGEQLTLSAREFTVLEHLAERVDRLVTPVELVRLTHNLDTDHGEASNLIRPVIRALRRKLGFPTGEMGCIETVRAVGYRLMAEVA